VKWQEVSGISYHVMSYHIILYHILTYILYHIHDGQNKVCMTQLKEETQSDVQDIYLSLYFAKNVT